jgi:phosphoribosylformylglycinamidine (FGAM) synthase-like amidotransferase family enzyme
LTAADTFGLGVCNGCQMFAELADIIPGAQAWPRFTTNQSERFEARLSMVEVLESPSLFFAGMAGARMPIAVAHGEGYANFKYRGNPAQATGCDALCGRPRQAVRVLSGQPQWQRRWIDGSDHSQTGASLP